MPETSHFRRTVGRIVGRLLRTPDPPADNAGLLAESNWDRARREANEWATNRYSFSFIEILTGVIGAAAAAVAFGGWVAVIVGGVLGLALAFVLILLWEGVYKTPRRQLALALAENARLVTAAEGKLPPQEIHAIGILVDRASELAETWRRSLPNYPAIAQSNSDFRSWCDDVGNFLARIQARPLIYTEFKSLTPMRHDRGNFLEDAAADLCRRRDWLLAFANDLDGND